MKTISDLIRLLQTAREIHGDAPVYIFDDIADFPFDVIACEDEVHDDPPRGYPDMSRPHRIVLHSVESARPPKKGES